MRITIVKTVAAGTVASIVFAGIAFAPPALAAPTATQPVPGDRFARSTSQLATLTEPITERANPTKSSGGAK
jgi:hypothetical protein